MSSFTKLISRVINPTRPTNIIKATNSLLRFPSCGVIFKLEPTVEKAETVSNNNPLCDKFGSNIIKRIKKNRIQKIELTITAEARLIEFSESSRLNSTTLLRPFITDKKLAIETTKVFILIPPAVD